jgi:hypothetical protein
MNSDDEKIRNLRKELEIGIKLKKDLGELMTELSKEGYSDSQIANLYADVKASLSKQTRDIISVVALGAIIGVAAYYLWPLMRWSDRQPLSGSMVFSGLFYLLLGGIAAVVASKGRITPLAMFMYWVSSGAMDPTEEMDLRETMLYENGKILIGIGLIVIMIACAV